ncbi:alpha/beta fold hydrolase [Nocardia macrotermitis]|uniref:Soluble epoxide hydrolase n=1 Tax=Nocardia macrotermitis TaxID=2585198 RepID=A0A7K0DE55_9NOCA|nr:alpha/beta hydrolase [Nocardia macrotermitis]MQY24083.1 Soluble epoxide hydrolase [Nocardia macrotermitis]
MSGERSEIEVRQVAANGIEISVALAGSGPAILLLHGFPHTWQLWRAVIGPLAQRHRVIAPDLRGFGASTRAADGYDARTLADDAAALLTALGESRATVVAIDAAVPAAFLLALRRPGPVDRLVLMESLLGTLPGAETFLRAGPPWWFGFHAVPGLAERVLTGHEPEYIDWFLHNGTLGRGIPAPIRDAFVAAYTGTEALRCAFSYYRALPETAGQLRAAVAATRLTVPTLAIGAQPVGATLADQLRPVADDLTARLIPECGHIIPLHRPDALLPILAEFLEPVAAESAGLTCSSGE